MTIREMHVMFRQYAQQMGMQNVRAILPEQIDLLINNSINDVINQVITQNIGTTNDRVITDNSKLNQINALKSLYKVWKGKVTLGTAKTNYIASYEFPINAFKNGGTYNNDGVNSTSISYIYIVDLSISYKKDSDFVSNIFPIRIIDDMYLADVVNDFILHPTFRSPVATVHDNTIELYIDKAEISVDGETSTLDTAAQIIDGRTMLPLRAVVEALGKEVFWDARGLIVISDSEIVTDEDAQAVSDIVSKF